LSQNLRPDPRTPGRWVWNYPRAAAFWSALGFVVASLVALGLTATFVWMVFIVTSEQSASPLSDWLSCALAGGSATVVCLLANRTAHNVWGKWHGSIAVTATHLELDLAAHRSLIHAPPRVVARLALDAIEAIETRLESYPQWGMAEIQRSYRLCLKCSDSILLFEQRALGTNQESADMDELAESLAQRIGVPLRDLGMVAGKLGFLGIIGGEAAAWNAAPLSPERERAMVGRAMLTGALPGMIMLAVLLLKALLAFGRSIF
jgi:hypothetical protein